VERYELGGPGGLADRSRRPHSCPHVTDEAIIEALVRARMKHPTWGPKKLHLNSPLLLSTGNIHGSGYPETEGPHHWQQEKTSEKTSRMSEDHFKGTE
jgi:hypothetical protein